MKTEGPCTNVEKIASEEISGVYGRLAQELMETKPTYPDVS